MLGQSEAMRLLSSACTLSIGGEGTRSSAEHARSQDQPRMAVGEPEGGERAILEGSIPQSSNSRAAMTLNDTRRREIPASRARKNQPFQD